MNNRQFDDKPLSTASVLSDLRNEGFSEEILSDLHAIAQIRAARDTAETGISPGEYVEERDTGRIYQVTGRTDDTVRVLDDFTEITMPLNTVFSPFAYAERIGEMCSEAIRVRRLAQRAAQEITERRHEAIRPTTISAEEVCENLRRSLNNNANKPDD